jgi:hypothetical protein
MRGSLDRLLRLLVCAAALAAGTASVDPYACDLRFRVNGGAAHSVPVASAASAAGGRALAARIADAAAAARVDEFSVCASALAGRAEAVAAGPVAVYLWPHNRTGWKRADVWRVAVSPGEDVEGKPSLPCFSCKSVCFVCVECVLCECGGRSVCALLSPVR